MARPARFARQLWSHIDGIYAAILDHPFIRGLTDGQLPRSAFKHYVVQDSLYLQEYARALSVAAARAPDEGAVAMFNSHAFGAIEVERALHKELLSQFRLSQQAARATPMAPTNRAYTSYLLAVVYGRPFCEGLAALLPCYWIYREVGKALLRKGSPDPLYQRWIDTYGGEEFGRIVRDVLALTDRVGKGLGPADREAMVEHFVTTSRYEWMFWDMGYREETWPV